MLADGLAERLGQRLARGRAAAEAAMTLTLTAHAPSGTELGPNGREVLGFADKGATRGKVQAGTQGGTDTVDRSINIGGVDRPILAGGLHIPIAAPVPVAGEQRGIGWEYSIDAVGPSDDPALLGRRYLVVGVPVKSFATARRLDVVEV